MSQSFSDVHPSRRRSRPYVPFQADMFLSQLRGKDLFDCVGQLEKLSRQIASRGAITLNGTTAEKKSARSLLIEKIHEYEGMYINTPQSYPEPQIPADILAIYSRLQLLPAKAVIDTLTHHMTLNMSRMDANEISGIPGYFANLGVYPRHDFMTEWWASAKSASGNWDLKDKYRIIYQLAILDCISQQEGYGESPCPEIVRPIMNIIEARAEHFFPDFIDGQIYYAAKWFKYGFIEGRTIQASAEKISETEKALSAGLNGKGLTILDDHVLHGTQHRFDLVVAFNRNSVGIEVDGPSHFVQDSENKCIRYDGSTRFHTALIEGMMGENFRVLRIPFPQLERANAIENVQQTLRHLNRFPKGAVYIMRGAKSVIQTDKTESWAVAHPALHR